jgi:GH15 family glucan-1,4-alpha-glucosidase
MNSRKAEKMPDQGLFTYLIAEDYTTESIAKIKEVVAAHGTHEIRPVANGLYAASGSQAPDSSTGYQNVWVRDNIMVANSLRLRGITKPAIACMQGLTGFFKKQVPRFQEIIDDPVRVLKEDANRRPHIRFTAENLSELPEKWPHAQNDALGQALWFRMVLANAGMLAMTPEDWKTYSLFPGYFEAIEYWQDNDSGAWEEGRKTNNSSVGAVVGGLEELLKYLTVADGRSSAGVASLSGAGIAKVEKLIATGRARLAETLPFEAPPERLADSAILFLIHPLGTVRARAIQDAIMNLVQARLKGEHGIKRYANDSYFCQDYDEWFAPSEMSSDFSERNDFRDAFLQPGCEAQWCIFDPVLSIIYGERYLADSSDVVSYRKQVHYFNRSLRQVTSEGHCPELYFLKQGRYVANAHTPLAWTQANQALALHLMEKSVAKNKA